MQNERSPSHTHLVRHLIRNNCKPLRPIQRLIRREVIKVHPRINNLRNDGARAILRDRNFDTLKVSHELQGPYTQSAIGGEQLGVAESDAEVDTGAANDEICVAVLA